MKKQRPFSRRQNTEDLSPIKKRLQNREYDIEGHHTAVQSKLCPKVILTGAKS